MTARVIDLTPFAETSLPQVFVIVFPTMARNTAVMGFELTIVSGRVGALRDCPPGWQIEAENDASWHATLRAHATVGAAAIDPNKLRQMPLFAPAPATVRDSVTGKFYVVGIVTVMRDGILTRLPPHTLCIAAVNKHPQTDQRAG